MIVLKIRRIGQELSMLFKNFCQRGGRMNFHNSKELGTQFKHSKTVKSFIPMLVTMLQSFRKLQKELSLPYQDLSHGEEDEVARLPMDSSTLGTF
jgi:hypothetical protein